MSLRWHLILAYRELRWRAVHGVWEAVRRAGQVTADTPGGRKFAAFGRGSALAFPTGAIYGEPCIAVGADTLIGVHVTLSAGTLAAREQPSSGPTLLRIGDRCVIGRGSHIVAHASVDVGDDVWTGPYVYITDQNHGYADPDVPIGQQWPVNATVSVGAGSWLGAGAIVLPGASIGRNVVVAAGSVVRDKFPDHCVIAGAPARIVRQYVDGEGWPRTGHKPRSWEEACDFPGANAHDQGSGGSAVDVEGV